MHTPAHPPCARRPRPGLRSLALALLLVASLGQALARTPAPSDASALSAVPLAVLVSAPVVLLSGAGALGVVAVEASADGAVWVLERASDGARLSVRVAGTASVAVGSSVQVTALAAGWVLSQGGRVLALVPNALGQALLHHQQVAR